MTVKSKLGLSLISTIITLLIIAILGFVVVSFFYEAESDIENTNAPTSADYSDYVTNLRSGGPPPNGIPPVENPQYLSVSEVDFLVDKDVVFVLDYNGMVKIYPQKILVWHEIVNEEINGEKVSVTYCPLTGSAIGYMGDISGIGETTYGTSGKLLNSNLVMYDRETESYIPQILGVGINGDLEGIRLDAIPVVWTTWDLARAKYPAAEVLSTDTGYIRNYFTDPYGSYIERGNYYDENYVLFPVMNEDNQLAAKEVVIGIRGKNSNFAIKKDIMQTEIVKTFGSDEELFVAFYDEELDTIRVFSRQFNGDALSFSYNNGVISDNNDIEWNVIGESSVGQLEWIDSFDVMWFAWSAFFPNAELVSR